jgi:hypothetical protein
MNIYCFLVNLRSITTNNIFLIFLNEEDVIPTGFFLGYSLFLQIFRPAGTKKRVPIQMESKQWNQNN